MAMRYVLTDCIDAYGRGGARPVQTAFVGGIDAARRVREGEAFDFVVLAADAIDALTVAGCVERGSRTDLARSEIAVAVATGATKPDIACEAALREAVLRAGTIGYSTGPSGNHVMQLFDRWGIAGTIAPRLVRAPPGVPVAVLVARGDVELGFQQLGEMLHEPGIDVVGLLPPDIQSATVFSAAIAAATKHREATAALLAYLASASCDTAKRRHGMAPARAET